MNIFTLNMNINVSQCIITIQLSYLQIIQLGNAFKVFCVIIKITFTLCITCEVIFLHVLMFRGHC